MESILEQTSSISKNSAFSPQEPSSDCGTINLIFRRYTTQLGGASGSVRNAKAHEWPRVNLAAVSCFVQLAADCQKGHGLCTHQVADSCSFGARLGPCEKLARKTTLRLNDDERFRHHLIIAVLHSLTHSWNRFYRLISTQREMAVALVCARAAGLFVCLFMHDDTYGRWFWRQSQRIDDGSIDGGAAEE